MHLLMWLIFATLPSLAWSATPLVEWRLDDVGWNGVPNAVTNAAANRYHGIWVNPSANPATLSPVISGATGSCGYGHFNATSYIDGGNPDLGLTDQLTVMAWVRWDIDPANGTPRATILANNSTTTAGDGQFWLQQSQDNSRYEFVVKTTDGTRTVAANTGPKPVLGQWQHVAGVYDGATLTIYVNGVANWSIVHTGRFLYQSTYRLQVGRWAHSSEAARTFRGAIDEVRLYHTALSQADIQQVMRVKRPCGTGFTSHLAPELKPVVDVHMDERLWRSTTEPVHDSSGNTFHGVAMNGATPALDSPALPGSQGTCGYGVFNGANQYVNFGTPNLNLTGQVTAMAWIRWDIDPRTGNPWANVVTNNRTSVAEQGQFWLQHNSDNSRFEFVVQTTSWKKRLLSITQPEQGVWYHVAGGYDGRNLMIFVNGTLENSDTHAGTFVSQADHQLTVAQWSHTSQNYRAFHGNIDEVRIYRQGLSAAAIARAAAATHTCTNTSLATPPQLGIASHTSGMGVMPEGFTLSGTLADAGNDLVQFVITIDDPILGRTVNQRPVQVDPLTGAWTFLITADLVSPGQTVTVALTAVDAEQTTTTKSLQLRVVPNPVALWHLDVQPTWSGATGEIADVSGSQFHGQAMHGAANLAASPALPGDNGTCGYGTFNGINQHLALGNPNFSWLYDKLTVMAWMRWAIDPATGNPRATIITNNREMENDNGQFWLYHIWNNTGFAFAVQTDLGRMEIRSNTQPQQGVWYHVAGVYDGKWLRILVNGAEERAIAHGGRFLFNANNRLTIGYSANASNAHRAFRGDIDEVQVYKAALSKAEIAALAAARHRCLPDASLPPVLTLASHHDGDAVLYSGFTLKGLVSDSGSPVQILVDVDDPVLGRTVNGRKASVNATTGQWTLAVAAAEISPNRNITVTVRALDSNGQETRLSLKFTVVPAPLALWHMEAAQQWQGAAGEVFDATGHGYSGRSMYGAHVLYDTPALGDSTVGSCGYAAFDGAQQYIDLGAPDLRLTNVVTVMAWVRWDIDPATGNPRATLVSNNSRTVLDSGQFWLRHDWYNAHFEYAVQTSAGVLSVTSMTRPQAGRWYHIAGVYNGSALIIYVNGVEERRQAHSGTFTYNSGYQLQLARSAMPNQNYRAFAGSLDEVQIHKRALAANEIAAVAYERRVCPATPALTLELDAQSLESVVQDNGVLLSGVVSSGYTLTPVEVRLFDAVRGQLLGQYTANITAQGRWAVLVDSALLVPGQAVRVEVIAVDTAGNSARRSFTFNVVPFDRQSRQLVNRITFGGTPALLEEIAALGTTNFLAQQLAPQTVDDQVFASVLAGFEPTTFRELQRYRLLHAIYSRRQLREVMTEFWDNHFNTDFRKHFIVAYELAENRAFRNQALGRFRDLLAISAKSPAMLRYLDNAASTKWGPNENYARELLELHTLGVHGGYTQTDVEQVAKAFTGWGISNDAFFFDITRHDTSVKTVLGQVIPSGGINEGETILHRLANHPSTAQFICTKLSQLLVSDTPTAALVQRCAEKFLGSATAPDQMAQVVELLLTTPEFMQAGNFRSKVKTPLEFVAGVVRNLDGTPEGDDLAAAIDLMGQSLFGYPVPTGYDETGTYWLSTNQFAERVKFVNRIALNTPGNGRTSIDPVAFFTAHGRDTAESIVHFLCTLAFGDDYTQLEWTIARDVLTDNAATVFDIHATGADRKLRQLIGTVFSYPGYLYQ